jgi:hypothetical protein
MFKSSHSKLRLAGLALAVLSLTHANSSAAQECLEDVDCGHGFQCIHDSAGTSSVTGVGGSTMPECGDGICEAGSEDIDSCPDDCDTIQYCAPAECTTDADCAEGYECGDEVGSNSVSTSGGGTAGSVCGDGVCDFDESNASCPDDCEVYRLCQVARVVCTSDEDCADGFYCYLDQDSTNVAVAVASVDSGSDTATDGSDGSSDSSNTDGADSGTGDSFAPPATSGGDESGICLPEVSDTTGGSNNVATIGGETVGSSATSGGDSGGDNNANAESSGTDGSGGVNTAAGNDSASATGGASSDTGGASGDDASSDDAGCSCTLAGSGAGPKSFLLLLLGLAVSVWRRPARRS